MDVRGTLGNYRYRVDLDIEWALSEMTPETMVWLMQHGFTLRTDADDDDYLHKAAAVGNTKLVAFLLQKGFLLNAPTPFNRETPLMRAVDGSFTETVQYLLAQGADLNHCDRNHENALDHALLVRSMEWKTREQKAGADTIIQLLRKQGAKPSGSSLRRKQG